MIPGPVETLQKGDADPGLRRAAPQYVDQIRLLVREGPESSINYYFRGALRLLFEKYAETLRKAK